MRIWNFFKRLSYSDSLRRTARSLHLSTALRKAYYVWARPQHGVLQVEVHGVSGRFWAGTPGEFRMAEGRGGEQHTLEFLLSALKPDDVFYDIGGSFGLYTVLAAKAVGTQGRVVAFEPEKKSYQRLAENVKLNELTNVQVFRKALGEQTAEAKLYDDAEEPWKSKLSAQANTTQAHYEVVEMVQGDEFRKGENLPLPRAVKIDVEGHEYAVICGLHQTLAQPSCEILCCEIHPSLLPPTITPETVLQLVRSLGFARIETHLRGDQFHAIGYKTA